MPTARSARIPTTAAWRYGVPAIVLHWLLAMLIAGMVALGWYMTTIEKLPQGYATPVHERGVGLSIGERQLIAFARALLSDPRILVLDEATANLDTRSEAIVQRGIRELTQGRTAVIIAHRLSTIRDADRIVVLDGGRIVESGSHEALIQRDGLYHRLYAMAFQQPAGGNGAAAEPAEAAGKTPQT